MARLTLSDAARRALRQAPVAHRELARRMGVSNVLVSRIVTGQRSATVATVTKLIGALDGLAGEAATLAADLRKAMRPSRP